MGNSFKKFMSLFMIVLSVFILISCVEPEPNPDPDPDPETYTVTFDADNGTTSVVVTVEAGSKVTKPVDPTKEGFNFVGWYFNTLLFDFDTTEIATNITLKAHWEEIAQNQEYTVTFNTLGGGAVESVVVISGATVTAPAAPLKDDFSFEAWTLNGQPYNFQTPVTSNLTLVAKYNYIGIPDSPLYQGRNFNADFDQMINPFTSSTLTSEMAQNATISADQPFIRVGYSSGIGNNPDGALWKQAGSQNTSSAAFQYLVIRMRGFKGASVNDLAIGFRYDDNHEVLVVPFTETLDPDQEANTRELDGTWFNYVISITDTLDGKTYVGKPGHADIDAGGVLVGFHLMNMSNVGSGVLEIKDAYFSKVPNPVYPYEGSNYNQNKDYWSGTIGETVTSYVSIKESGFYGEFLEDATLANTHLVLRLKQSSHGTLDYNHIKLAPVFTDGTTGEYVAFSNIEGLPQLGSSWLNLTIPFTAIYEGEKTIGGYKLFNEGDAEIAISQSFLSYLGDYEAVEYPLLDFENIQMFDNFNRATIGATPVWTADNEVALNNGFSYIISYAGIQASTIGDGYITLDSTGGDFVDYVVHSTAKGNLHQYRYFVMKYKLNGEGTLNDLRMIQKTTGDANVAGAIYANQWLAGLGLPSIPEDMSSYPYQDGEWTYLIVDLLLTEGLSTDFGGFSLYYTGSSLSIDAMFFANAASLVDESSFFLINDFEGLDLGSAQDKTSDNQWWANVYESPTTIVEDGEDNQALQIDGTGYAQYHTGIKGAGRYLSFDLKIATPGSIVSFRVGPTGEPGWAKEGQLILSNGLPMVVNTDGNWHHYVIDWVASGFQLTDTIGFHASDGEIYLIDNLAWLQEKSYYDDGLEWGTWEWATVGDANGQAGPNQYWMNNYGSASSIVEIEGNKWLKLDASSGYVQIHTGVMAKPQFIKFVIKVEKEGSLGIHTGGTHKWNTELIGLDGNPITLPGVGETATIIVDVAKSGLLHSDEFGIEANDGAIFYIDNISFEWQTPVHDLYRFFDESFDETPTNDGEKYWWGEWTTVSEGVVNLVTDGYTTLRFGSPQARLSRYFVFEVKLAEGKTADSFRLELGDGNIVTFQTLIDDGFASALSEDYQLVVVDLSHYVENLAGLQVFGFHINEGGVVIDNFGLSYDAYTAAMLAFNQE